MHMNLADKLRLSNIKRWTIISTNKNQSVAEHSYGASIIADAISERLGLNLDVRNCIIHYILRHDIPEIFSGDIPAPFKKYLNNNIPEFDSWYKKFENDCEPILGELIDSDSEIKVIIKIADILESARFIDTYGNDELTNRVVNHLESECLNLIKNGDKIIPGLADVAIGIIEELNKEAHLVIDFLNE